MSLAPILPTLLPFAGALILALTPARWRVASIFKHLPLAVLSASIVCLLALAIGPIETGVLTLTSPLPMSIKSLGFIWDGLALQCALLPILGLAVESTVHQDPDATRLTWVGQLVAIGACVAGCAAADLVTLCFCWAAMDAALVLADLVEAPEPAVAMGMQRAWTRGLSLFAVVVAAMLLTFGQGRTAWAYASLDGTAQALLVAAAWLRLGVFPLSGGEGISVTSRLIALGSGGYIWLRLGSVAILSPTQPWVSILIAFGAGLLGLVALLAQQEERRLEAIHLQGLTMMILASLVDPVAGPGVGMLILVGLAVALIAQVGWENRASLGLGVWEIAPWLVVVASLGGMPLTLLGGARWFLLRSVALAGQRVILVLVGGACALVSVACWRSIRRIWSAHDLRLAKATCAGRRTWQAWVVWGALSVCAIVMLVAGIVPSSVEQVWRGGFAGIDIPLLRATTPSGWRLLFVVGSMIVLVPAMAIWITERVHRKGQGSWYRGPIRDILARFIALDWLYVGLSQGLGVLQAGLRRLVRVIEESFVMGWTIFWALVFVLYLTSL